MRDKNLGALKSMKVANNVMNAFPVIDLALRVTEMEDGSGLEFYVVVEASYTGKSEDIETAAVRARMLGAITGCNAYAVVAAVKPNKGLEDRVTGTLGSTWRQTTERGPFGIRLLTRSWSPRRPARQRPALGKTQCLTT